MWDKYLRKHDCELLNSGMGEQIKSSGDHPSLFV